MAVAQSFRIMRAGVSSGVLTPVNPPVTCTEVSIFNLTAADLQVHTNSDESEYLVVAAGYERLFPVRTKWFSPSELAFWLKPGATGTVVLVWY